MFGPVALVLISMCAQAQTPELKFDLKLRERVEIWNGMNALNYGDNRPSAPGKLDDRMLLQRMVAGFVWQPLVNTRISFHLQDARAFGWSLRYSLNTDYFKVHAKGQDEPYYIMNPNEEFFEINDLYLEHTIGHYTLTIGRQKIAFGDNRIFGPGEWGNTGRWTWDALRLHWSKGRRSLDIFAGGTKTHNPVVTTLPFSQMEYTGAGLYGQFELAKGFALEPFYAWKGPGNAPYARDRKLNMHWLGLRSTGNLAKNFSFDLTMVGQMGEKEGQKVKALATAAKLSYQLRNLPSRPELALRHSYASGGKSSDGRLHTFDPAFGARDRYYGLMNLLSWSNLDDREIIFALRPDRRNSIELAYHWFFVPHPENQLINGTLRLKPGQHYLGSELNVQWRAKVNDKLEFTGIFGRFMPGKVQPVAGKIPQQATYFSIQLVWQIEHALKKAKRN
jgi:hypothetical protein